MLKKLDACVNLIAAAIVREQLEAADAVSKSDTILLKDSDLLQPFKYGTTHTEIQDSFQQMT